MRHIGISSLSISLSSMAVRGFQAKDVSSMAVVETEGERASVEVEAPD